MEAAVGGKCMDEKRNLHSVLDQYLFLSAEPFVLDASYVVKGSETISKNHIMDCMIITTDVVTFSKTLFFLSTMVVNRV